MSLDLPIENLLKWLRTFNTAASVHSIHDISDGIILAKVLHSIAPNHFTEEWLQKFNYEAGINWRLKEIEDRISVHLLPNLQEIAEHEDNESTFRLLQLILGCAVNCDNKETYIQIIMCMEESVQQALMEAIQQLMSSRLGGVSGLSSMSSASSSDHGGGAAAAAAGGLGVASGGLIDYEDRLCKAAEQYKTLLIEKEQLAEQCNALKIEVFNLQEEKSTLQSELNQLKVQLNSLGYNHQLLTTESSLSTTTTITPSQSQSTPSSIEPLPITLNPIDTNNVIMSPTIANVRIGHLQNQLSKLRDELYRTECDKEELKIKLTEMTTRNQELKQKCSILAAKAEESVHLKDELDIAREEASNALRLSATIEQLRKHADEAVSLRARCSQLETDNQVCMQRLAELEQETRLGGKIRSQVKAQRLQAEDAQLEASEAIRRAELAEQELNKIRQELIATNREKECIFSELTRLRSCCEGLQSCAQLSNYGTPVNNDHNKTSQLDSSSILSPAMQSQMLNLQEELSRLRTSMYSMESGSIHGGSGVDDSGGGGGVGEDDADYIGDDDDDKLAFESSNLLICQSPPASDMLVTSTSNTSRAQNRHHLTTATATDCALSIAASDVIQSAKKGDTDVVDEQQEQLQEAYNNLLTRLTQKESDFIEMEQKYRGYLWKAREVIRLLERQHRIHQDICPEYRKKSFSLKQQENSSNENNNNIVDSDSDNNNNNSNNNSRKYDEEISHLRSLLVEKERVIEKLETHHEQMRRHREAEERLLLTAWYNLIIQSTQNTVEDGLKQQSCENCNYPIKSPRTTTSKSNHTKSSTAENNLSFLARQRNVHLKPPKDLTSVVMSSR
ncbi:unnamed protein product [Trichobilharzia szidati]|nr:unnamed protein product [Trichobilharzia szidati]